MLYARSTCQEQPRAQLNRYNHFAPAAGACVASFLLFVMWKRNSLKLVTSKECSTCACLCTYLRKAPQYIKTLALKKKKLLSFQQICFLCSHHNSKHELFSKWTVAKICVDDVYSRLKIKQAPPTLFWISAGSMFVILLGGTYSEKTVAQAKCYPAKHEPTPLPPTTLPNRK